MIPLSELSHLNKVIIPSTGNSNNTRKHFFYILIPSALMIILTFYITNKNKKSVPDEYIT